MLALLIYSVYYGYKLTKPYKNKMYPNVYIEDIDISNIKLNKIEEKIVTETPKDEVKMIKIEELRSNPYQPRKNFDPIALQELSKSIKEHGVFQPIIAKYKRL